MTTPCTVKKIQLTEVMYGQIYVGPIDADGLASDPELYRDTTDALERRQFFCNNCQQVFEGSDTFSIVKAHLGGVVASDSKVSLGGIALADLPSW